MLAAIQIVGGTINVPYGLNASLLRQTVATEIGSPSSRVSVDPDMHALVVDLRRLANECGFRDDDDLLALYNMPGIVYALGGRSPGIPWYTSGLPGSRLVNQMGLDYAKMDFIYNGRTFHLIEEGGGPIKQIIG